MQTFLQFVVGIIDLFILHVQTQCLLEFVWSFIQHAHHFCLTLVVDATRLVDCMTQVGCIFEPDQWMHLAKWIVESATGISYTVVITR